MPVEHIVRQGECISSIAFDHGLSPATIWDFPDNVDLKRKRKDPNVLIEGDVVMIPDKEQRIESRPTDARHRFRRKGVPEYLRVKLLDEHDEPRKDLRYVLNVDGVSMTGTTDAEGMIEHAIPPNARDGLLVVEPGAGEERIRLDLGHLNPIDEVSGIWMRLSNLGFDCGPEGDSPRLQEALREFQRQYKLTETGEIDEATSLKLKALYGS